MNLRMVKMELRLYKRYKSMGYHIEVYKSDEYRVKFDIDNLKVEFYAKSPLYEMLTGESGVKEYFERWENGLDEYLKREGSK